MSPRAGTSLFTAAIIALIAATGCGGAQHYNPALIEQLSRPGTAEVQQECGANASFGVVSAGSLVVLRPHRAVGGDRNWVAGMRPYLNQTTRVTARTGRDPQGCPVVQVAVDRGRFFWRVRDMTVIGRGLGPGGGDAVPQRCEQDEDTADFGLIQPGARVVLWRHRDIEGETNWIDEMSDHVGQIARVEQIGSVDAVGCPVFHVDLDRGEWAWRVRDVTLIEAALPQLCGQQSEPDYGAATVGARVRLFHHRPVRGERNWRSTMEQYVDRDARVTSLGPPDDQGCPIVHVNLDQGSQAWRLRDLVLLEGTAQEGEEPPGEAAIRADPTGGTNEDGIPQGCAQSGSAVNYGPIREGTRVVLGRHSDVGGDANWANEMEPFVGRQATVTGFSGADAAGCPGVRVDADNGEWFWRIRDMELAE